MLLKSQSNQIHTRTSVLPTKLHRAIVILTFIGDYFIRCLLIGTHVPDCMTTLSSCFAREIPMFIRQQGKTTLHNHVYQDRFFISLLNMK